MCSKIVVRKNFFGNKLIKCFNKIFNSREEVQDFFRTMDRDFDQKLTFAEFMGEESHIEKLFKSMDKNNDGFVTKKVKLCQNETMCTSFYFQEHPDLQTEPLTTF